MTESNKVGRGPRLPHSRISVQDLLPHFKQGESDDVIAPHYPSIGVSDIRLLRQYYLDHTEEVLAYEMEVAKYHAELRKQYQRPSPLDSLSPQDRIDFLRSRLAKKVTAEANGAHRSAR